MINHQDVDRSLGETLAAVSAEPFFTWTLSEQAENAITNFERERDSALLPPSGVLLETRPTKAQIDSVVATIAAADVLDLRRASEESRLQVGFDEDGYAIGIDNEVCADSVMAALYRMIAHRGAAARLTAEDEAAMKGDGRSRADIEALRILLLDVAAEERRASWRLGPSREALAKTLVDAGIEPALATIHAVRRKILLSRAALLQQLADPCRSNDEDAPPVAMPKGAVMAKQDAPDDLVVETPAPRLQTPQVVTQAPSGGHCESFLGLTEAFIEKRKKRMGDHSIRQYRSVAKLFVKTTGTDDPNAMSQGHIGNFFDLLPKLPKAHGKSPADEGRTIEEIIARGEAAVLQSGKPREELIGLDPPTVDRYVTQLGALLKYMKGRGFVIGDLDTLVDMREPDDEADEDKRLAFSIAEDTKVLNSPLWSGCESEGARTVPGSIVVHDATFFVPLLAKYELMSLSEATGLMLSDIDDACLIPSIEIRNNALRETLKTPTRSRRQPIHPELIRLGFLDYVRCLRALGFTILFPDLRLRGEATPMSNLFNKSWVPILDAALPKARQEKKTIHSFRKGGNTQLTTIPSIVAPEVRLQLMGHKQNSVNGRHYLAPFPDHVKLAALNNLTVTTAAVLPAKIRLAAAVKEYAAQRDSADKRLI